MNEFRKLMESINTIETDSTFEQLMDDISKIQHHYKLNESKLI